jgi:hypothetical protein
MVVSLSARRSPVGRDETVASGPETLHSMEVVRRNEDLSHFAEPGFPT